MNKKSVQYLHHGILAIIAFLYSWATIYEELNSLLLSTIIGFGSYFIYRLAYYQPIFNLKDLMISLKINPSKLDLFLLLIVCIITISSLTINNLLLLSTTGFLSALYFLIIQLPKLKSNGIRKLPFIKNVFLAAMWTIATLILPFYFVGNIQFHEISVLTRFLYILIICVAIDLRDIKADEKAGTTTLPTWIGFKNTKLICFILLMVYFALLPQINVINGSYVVQNADELIYYGTGIILGLILIFLNEKLERRIYTILLDGCMLLQAVGLFIISALKIG